ncbi:S-Ena type endospore appendage [Paenibacillus sp. CAU 1782]
MAGKRGKRDWKNRGITANKAAHRPKQRRSSLKPFQLPQRSLMQFVSTYTKPAAKPLPVAPAISSTTDDSSAMEPAMPLSIQQNNDFCHMNTRPFVQDKECCGNFLIHDFPKTSIQLWLLGQHLKVVLSQISLYNSPSSTGSVEVHACGEESATFVVQPGNTGTYTGTGITKVSINFKEGNPSFIEGKYVVSSSIWLLRPNCHNDDCDYE